jgi:ATP-dependent protease ClpP protease subunit
MKNKKFTNELLDDLLDAHNNSCRVIKKKLNDYHIYFGETISSELLEYAACLHLLSTATSKTKITFHVSGFGGSTDTGIKLINKINTSKAQITAIIDGPVYSMHSMLASNFLLNYSNIKIMPDVYFMFHVMSMGHHGTISELKRSAEFYHQYDMSVNKKYAEPFLTKEETTRLIDGQDVFIMGNIIKRRLSNAKKKASNKIQ